LETCYPNRNNGADRTKDRNERGCPDGLVEQRRSDPHRHSHDEHDAAGMIAVSRFTAPYRLVADTAMALAPGSRQAMMSVAERATQYAIELRAERQVEP
jgi:hypothetical protein